MTARGALALAVLLAWPGQGMDDAVREWARASRSASLDPVMHAASDGARPALAVGAVAALAAGASSRLVLAEGVVVLAPLNLVVEGLKWSVNRTRPDGDRRRKNSSFPSSHAANAFAVAMLVSRRWRRSAWLAFPLAVLVAWSRIYLDRHWCSDVLAGSALGALAAWSVGSAFRAWWKRRNATAAA